MAAPPVEANAQRASSRDAHWQRSARSDTARDGVGLGSCYLALMVFPVPSHLANRTLRHVALCVIALACARETPRIEPQPQPGPPPGFSEPEWERVSELSPQPALPSSPTNAVADDPRAALLGQRLFFDAALSGPIVRASDLGEPGDAGRVACVSCHDPERWFVDRRSPGAGHGSLGTDLLVHRNTPTAVNVAYYAWYQWDGIFDSLWSHGTTTPEHPATFHGSRVRVARVLATRYRREYEALFGPWPQVELAAWPEDASPRSSLWMAVSGNEAQAQQWESRPPAEQDRIDEIFARYGKVMEAYLRTLRSGPAPFDRFVAGERGAISASAARGARLFVGKAACHECHSGPMLSDAAYDGRRRAWTGGFHNLGLAQNPAEIEGILDRDIGRGPLLAFVESTSRNVLTSFNGMSRFSDDPAHGEAKLRALSASDPERQTGAFRTPSLRNVAESAPYMHNGNLPTLESVIRFYDRGGDPDGFVGQRDKLIFALDLTEPEIADLVAFLETLTGEPVPEARRRRPDPAP